MRAANNRKLIQYRINTSPLLGSTSKLPLLCAVAAMASLASPAFGQDAAVDDQKSTGTLMDDIVVTATKQTNAQAAQNIPLTISAFSGNQIEKLKLTNVSNLAFAIPNVSFEGVSSFKGTANFSIRGLGLNSSAASTAPTVGQFVDGVYLGVNLGALFDTFDVDGIEILRGPQGTLFGRNVVGGAVLFNNAKPRQEFDFKVRARIESGPEYSLASAIGGGLTDNISARLAVLYRNDKGYFNNTTTGDKHVGADRVIVVRPALRLQQGSLDIVLRGEYGHQTGDAPVYKPIDHDPDGAGPLPVYGSSYNDVYDDLSGSTNLKWRNATLTTTLDVGFGENASITNIAGYRKVNHFSVFSSDGLPANIVHTNGLLKQNQRSNELRYNGKFGRATFTVGGLYFNQKYVQFNRNISISPPETYAGQIRESTYGLFGQVDYELSDQLTLQVGGRYSYEKKKARISALASEDPTLTRPGAFGIPGACTLIDRQPRCDFQYSLEDSWSSFTPKISLQYRLAERVQFYATAQKANRSGGFNVRYNAAGVPKPYDQENQDAYELGFKSDLFDRTTRFNGALFYTKVKKLQRDITIVDPVTSINTNLTENTANATLKGFELELVQKVTPDIEFNANVGYVDAKYDKILFDITADFTAGLTPTVDALDLMQKLPRVSPWTYSAGVNAGHDFAIGRLSFQGSFSHRDKSFFPDYNTNRRDGAVPVLPAINRFDAQISFEPANTGMSLTLYGRNLTNEFSLASFSPIGYPTLNACSCTVNKGRQLGMELNFRY